MLKCLATTYVKWPKPYSVKCGLEPDIDTPSLNSFTDCYSVQILSVTANSLERKYLSAQALLSFYLAIVPGSFR